MSIILLVKLFEKFQNSDIIDVAEYLGGTEEGFVQMMNSRAKQTDKKFDYLIPEELIEKIEIEKLLKLVGRLCEEDQKLIYSFYLTDEPMLETVYAKENGISRQVVHFRKERAIERLKKLYFS